MAWVTDQEEGIDLKESFAPEQELEAIRIFLRVCCTYEHVVYQTDGKTCVSEGKALYGLKQLHARYDMRLSFLISPSFSPKVQWIPQLFMTQPRRLGTTSGTRINLQTSQSPRGIFINQSKYALESLKKYGFDSCDPVDTPMVEKSKLNEDKEGNSLIRIRRILIRLPLTAFAECDHAVGKIHTRATSGSKQFFWEIEFISWSAKKAEKRCDILYGTEYIALPVDCANPLDENHSLPTMALVSTNSQCTVITKRYFAYAADNADIFTKALGPRKIEFLITSLGMRRPSLLLLGALFQPHGERDISSSFSMHHLSSYGEVLGE
ncbi:hypothetical protein Tco_1315955 [Tanacetum coccineum]